MASRFASLAQRIVETSVLKAEPKESRIAKADKKIVKMVETEERFKSVRGFMELWNKWRSFYFGMSPIQPKSRSQLTNIENAIEYCNENGFSLTIMIACIHKSYERRKLRPAFHEITTRGEEIYNVFHDEVMSDVDRDEYVKRAER